MHFSCVVIHRPRQDPEVLLHRHRSQWDWYQRGGRYTGFFTDYEPRNDPANQRPCSYCSATGTRFGKPNDCNACQGTGIYTEWPTNWASYEGDTQPIALWEPDRIPYRWITPERQYEVPWDPLGDAPYGPLIAEQIARAQERIEALKAAHPTALVTIFDLHY